MLIQDASGNLLASFENYNDLYCLTELLYHDHNKTSKEGPGCYHGEGLLVPGGSTPAVYAPAANYVQDMNINFNADSNPLSMVL